MNWTRNGWAARVAACVGGAAVGLAPAGCEENSPLADAISASTIKLAALSPGGSAAASEAYKARVYTDVVKALQPLAGKGTASQNASAYVLLAQAQVGLADAEADNAAQVERDSLNTLTLVEGALREWKHHNVQAATAVYDPNPELADIDTQARERADAMRAERAKKAEIDGRVSQLRAQARALAKDAGGKRAEQAQLSRQASNESAVKGEETLRRAAAIGREADGLEGEAADLEAQAAVIEPQGDQVQNAIDRLTSQTASLERTRTEVQQRAATAAEQVKASRDLATTAARDIEKFVGELTLARGGGEGGAAPYAAAVAGYQKAATTAKTGAKDANGRGMALLTAGGAKQSLGDVHWARAHGLARVLETLEGLTKSKPPLPNANRYQAQANETREARTAALDAATAAYQEAVEAYKGAGSTGDARERFQRVNERLARSINVTSNGKVDLLAEMRAASGESAGSGSGGGAVEPGSPQESIDQLLTALKGARFDEIPTYLHASNADNRRVLDATPALVQAGVRLNTACQSKFAKGLVEIAMAQFATMMGGASPLAAMGGEDPSAAFSEMMSELDRQTADQFRVELNGDTARVFPPDESEGSQGFPMIRVDGRWLIDLSEVEQMLAAQPDAPKYRELMVFVAPLITQVLNDVAGEVEAGTHATADAMMQAMNMRSMMMMGQIMGKMQELGIQMPAMPGMPGGGPGGG
ncbi:MAG: hypothetical protein ACKVU4_01680 [Phycisphaerales bacterium]